MLNYEIIVGNVGTVHTGANGAQALREYGAWIRESKENKGRAAGEPVSLMRDGEPWREYAPGPFWFFEVTDTFGGEANYCWACRYKVSAPTLRGALRKVSRDSGFVGQLKTSYSGRWDVRGAAICIFGDHWDDDCHAHYMTVREI